MKDLRKAALERKYPAEALTSCAKDLNAHSVPEIGINGTGLAHPLDPMALDELYCIGSEALANAFQNAKVSKIEIEPRHSQTENLLRVRDDGLGMADTIPVKVRPGDWGLSAIRERARGISGRMEVWSRPVAGRELSMTVPATAVYARCTPRALWIRPRSLTIGTS